MQIMKILISALIILIDITASFATPPYQVLQTCIHDKPYNEQVIITRLANAGSADKLLENCEDQYEFRYNKRTYGTVTCNEKFFLIINNQKIDLGLAHNMSINPEIQPGVEFTSRALWYKIDYENTAYLCILAPLAEQGIGSAYNQYYIIENAFASAATPEVYFYFLDKNIAPITSKTL